jgi:hypothetical protein
MTLRNQYSEQKASGKKTISTSFRNPKNADNSLLE